MRLTAMAWLDDRAPNGVDGAILNPQSESGVHLGELIGHILAMAAASTVEAHLKDGTYQEFDDVSGEDVIEYYAKVAVEYARVKYPAVLTRGAVK